MKSSTILSIIAVLVICIVGVWYFAFGRTDTMTEQIPGDNLTLGQNSTTELGAYLVGYNGMTLYTYAPDTPNISNCTGECAVHWPPYVVTSMANLVAESPIAGTISTLTRADGSVQVVYDSHPLYFYKGDASPNDTKGQGVGNTWFVLKP